MTKDNGAVMVCCGPGNNGEGGGCRQQFATNGRSGKSFLLISKF